NDGLAYTGRVEYLPLGRFTGENDYIEGDLEREPLPRLSLGGTISYNDKALREGGQVGSDLFSPRGIRTIEFDALLKYRGWALYNEFMQRRTSDPVTVETGTDEIMYVYDGEGYLSQLSYLFKNNFELAGRYSVIVPDDKLYANPVFPMINERKVRQIEFGVTKYLVGHRLKIQANVIR